MSPGDLTWCQGVPADQTFDGRLDPTLITPQQYANCGQSYIVDILDLDGHYTDPPPTPGITIIPAKVAVKWGDTPLTQAQCKSASLSAIFYSWSENGGGAIYHPRKYGVWINGGCQLELSLRTFQNIGWNFRVAAQAFYLNESRSASIGTYKPRIQR